MSEAPVFRVNLVRDPNNRNAQLYIQDVYEFVEYEMEVSYEDIVGLQRRGLHSYDVMIKREEYDKYIDTLNGFKDRKIELSNRKIVTVINPYEQLTYVVVRGFPMHWEIEKMNRIMSYYGEIRQVINERYNAKATEGTRYYGKWNGNIRYKMKLRTRIPCGLTVCDERLQIYYPEQEQACRKCDLGGHKWFNCKTPFRERTNIFNMEDFPELDEQIIPGSILRSKTTDENENHSENGKDNDKDTDMDNHEENNEKEEDQAARDTPIREVEQDLENGIGVNPGHPTDVKERSEKKYIENQDEILLASPDQGINSYENRKLETDTEYEELQLIEKTQEINLKEKVIDRDERGNIKKSTVTFDADFHHRDISQVFDKSSMEQDAEKYSCEGQKEERGKMDLEIQKGGEHGNNKNSTVIFGADSHHQDISQGLNKPSMEQDVEKLVCLGQKGERGQMDLDIQKGEMNPDIIDILNVEMGINDDIDSQVITPGQRTATDEEKNTQENTDTSKNKKRLASSEDEISDSFCGFVGPSNFKKDVKNTEDAKTNSKEKHERDKKKIRKVEHGKYE